MYQPVHSPESTCSDESYQDEQEKIYLSQNSLSKSRFSSYVCVAIFTLSILLNLIVVVLWLGTVEKVQTLERSPFAGLQRTIPKPWVLYDTSNETAQSELWDKTNIDAGNIALEDTYAKFMQLPRAQRFPWDSSKGIYLVNGYHNLHCVKTLHTSFVQFRSSTRQSTPWPHVLHCLNVLREEVLCNADDTPRYTGFQPHRSSGLGQVRMCRDWEQLEAWAIEHTACWRHVGDTSDPGFRELERYRFCPPGSPYAEVAATKWRHD